MNVLQSIALTAIAVVALVGAGWLLRGCYDEGDLSEERLVEIEAEKERALDHAARAESAAQADSAAAADVRALAEAKVEENDRLRAELRTEREAVRSAETRADELATRFAETGTLADCGAALASCTEARDELRDYAASAEVALERSDELLLLRMGEADRWRGAYDSTRVALGFQREACALCEEQYEIAGDLAARYRRQRNAVLVGGGLLIVGILVLK